MVGLWIQGDSVCPVCINSGKSKPPGVTQGQLVQACQFKSRFKKSLSTSWHFSSCHLFSVSGIKTQLKAQDVGCSQLPSFWFVCNYRLSACWGNLWRFPYFLSISSIPSVSSSLPLWENQASVIRNSHPALAAYFCHLATNHHLEIYPTIKSFSRNLAPRLWNARWSRSAWAVQSQSWSVCTLPPQCHLSCFWQTNAAPQETSEVRLVTKPPSSPAGAAAV